MLKLDRQTFGRTSSTAANKVLPKAGMKCFYDTFVQARTLVFQSTVGAETPRLRQYPDRWQTFY